MSPICASRRSSAQAGAPDFGAERARLIKAKADIAEMEAGGRRGELLPAEAVEAAWTAMLARLRARLLVLPDRLAPLCHEETTIAGVTRADPQRGPRGARRARGARRSSSPLILTGPERLAKAARTGAGDPEAAAGADDQ